MQQDFQIHGDISQVEQGGFAPLPNGDYAVRITKVELRDNGQNSKDPSGQHFSIEYSIDNSTRKHFENYNVRNTNPKAVEIGVRNIKGLLIGCFGEANVNSLGALNASHVFGVEGKELIITLGLDKNKENEIKAYKQQGTAATITPAAGGHPAQGGAAPQAGGEIPAFMQK